ncbi:MAG: hypothetical protein AAF985_01665 [Bacteroidota bacterium]
MKVKICLTFAIILQGIIACHAQTFQAELEDDDPAHFKMRDARFHKIFFKLVSYKRNVSVLDTRKDQLLAKKILLSCTLAILSYD